MALRLWAGARLGDVEGMIAGLAASAERGEPETVEQLAGRSAREYVIAELGFDDWGHLEREVARREMLEARDVVGLRALLDVDPGLATLELARWGDHCHSAAPVNFVAMLRYDTAGRVWRDVAGTGSVIAMLLEAGAPVDGQPGDAETPLITAASYGDAEAAKVLIEHGADLERRAAADAGGVPGGTALRHAAVFGMTDVVDVLIDAGARCEHVSVAAAAGDVSGWLTNQTSHDELIAALTMAADHERVDVIDELLAAGAPIDAVDAWGRQPLRIAAADGKVASVGHLLARGADANARDERGRSALDLAREHDHADTARYQEVQRLLEPVTTVR